MAPKPTTSRSSSAGSTTTTPTDGTQFKVKLVRFVRLPELIRTVGLGKTTVYKLISKGEFPRPVQIGDRAVGWVEDEIAAWANDRIAKARLTPAQVFQLEA